MQQHYHPTGQTAIIIVPPPDVCGYADYYRRLYMPEMMHNIEPHVTVAAPFAPYEQLAAVEPRLAKVLAGCPPTRLSFRGFSVFRESGVLYLRLAQPERVLSIYRAIHAECPEYPAYAGQHGDNFTPHLTLGSFTDPEELDKVHKELSVQRLYIGFEVEQVVGKYEMSDGIWDTWAELPLLGAA